MLKNSEVFQQLCSLFPSPPPPSNIDGREKLPAPSRSGPFLFFPIAFLFHLQNVTNGGWSRFWAAAPDGTKGGARERAIQVKILIIIAAVQLILLIWGFFFSLSFHKSLENDQI